MINKSEEKLKKIKDNTKFFDKIIEQKIANGEIVDIDVSIYQDDAMEECDGGKRSNMSNESFDLLKLIKNKKKVVNGHVRRKKHN